jgi:hypothetical protein
MTRTLKEPFICMALLILIIFELPYFNLFLVAGLLMLLLYTVVYRRQPVANGEMIVLLLFISLYFILDSQLAQSNTYKLWYAVSTVSLYTCGYYMRFDGLNIHERSIKVENVIKIIVFAYTAYVLITMIYSFTHGQFLLTRNPLNLWTGTLRAATHYGTMSIIPLAYGLHLTVGNEEKRGKFVGWLLIIFAIAVAVITASRTVLLLIPLGSIIAYFANIKMRGNFQQKHLNQLIASLILLALSVVVFVTDMFGVQTLFFRTQLGQRYILGYAPTLMNDGRFKNIEFFFQHIGQSMWGGGYSRINSGNLHNVYLNVFDLSGIIPFLLLVLFTICVIRDYKRAVKNNSVDIPTRLLLLLILSLAFIQMMLEPTMESVPVFMWCLLLICGMQNKVSHFTD